MGARECAAGGAMPWCGDACGARLLVRRDGSLPETAGERHHTFQPTCPDRSRPTKSPNARFLHRALPCPTLPRPISLPRISLHDGRGPPCLGTTYLVAVPSVRPDGHLRAERPPTLFACEAETNGSCIRRCWPVPFGQPGDTVPDGRFGEALACGILNENACLNVGPVTSQLRWFVVSGGPLNGFDRCPLRSSCQTIGGGRP